ncbi:MAG: hypothetical protein G01um101472_105 [Parcubacteria group bacterium Gr01-1014_72]|nr:MAG: hypothetical protein G01um101472_105 [Parcubacteria group bacterium Gr01-1014_72]
MFENKHIKNGVIAVLGFLAIFLLGKTITEFKGLKYVGAGAPPQGTITVSGKSERVVVPDLAVFTVGVTEEGAIVSVAQAATTEGINGIIAFLKTNGVAEKDIKTINYQIYPRYDYEREARPNYYPVPDGKRSLAGYTVTQTLEVKVRKLADAGKLLSGIGELGATDVSGLSFSVDKEEDIKKEIRGEAIADAAASAKGLARDLGVRILRVVSYSEGGYYPGPLYKLEAAYGRGGDSEPIAPEITPGEYKVTSNVSVTYEIR